MSNRINITPAPPVASAALDPDLVAIGNLTSAADKVPYSTGAQTWALTALTAFIRTLLDDADAATARATLGVVPGADVQAYDADLQAIATLTSAADKMAYATGAGTWSLADLTSFARTLLDDVNAAAARTTLGLRESGLFWTTGRYYSLNVGSASTTAATNGSLRAHRFYIPNDVTLVRIAGEITVAGESGCKLRMGIYADDGTMRPGSLIIDAGVMAGDVVAVAEVTVSQALSRGWYWAAGAVQGAPTTTPTLRTTAGASDQDLGTSLPGAATNPIAWAHSTTIPTLGTALPSTFTPTTVVGNSPRLMGKV